MKETYYNQMGLTASPPRLRGKPQSRLTAMAAGGLLSCLGMWGTVGCFLTAFHLSVPLPVFLACTLLFPLVWTVLLGLGRARLPLCLALSAGWLFCLFQLRRPLLQGFLHTVNYLFQVLARQSGLVMPQYLVEPVSQYAAQNLISLFGLLCLFPLSALVAWTTGRQGRFLTGFLSTLALPLFPLWFQLQPAPWALLPLVLLWAALGFARLSPRRDRAAAAALALALPLALCLALVYLAAPMDAYHRPPAMEALRVQAEAWVRALPGQLADLSSGSLPGGGVLTRDQRRRSFRGLGRLSFTGRTDLRVKVSEDEPGPLYLAGFTGAVYQSDGWFSLPDEDLARLAASTGPDVHPQNLTSLSAAFGFPVLDITVQNHSNRKMVYAPPLLASTPQDLPQMDFLGDAGLRARDFLGLEEYTLSYLALQPVRGVEWNAPGPDYLRWLLEKHAAYNETALDYYLQVPESLKPMLDDIVADMLEHSPYIAYSSSAVHTPPDDISLIWLVQDYLQDSGQFSYTLTPGPVPAGRDPMDYFLTESRQGYCVHFASAATLLLRHMGVPARYREGYLVTQGDLSAKDPDGFSNVPDRRAHAWVEVLLPEEGGWFTLDCTPGFQPHQGQVQPNNETNEIPPTPRPTQTPNPTETPVATPNPTPIPSQTPAPQAPVEEENTWSPNALWPVLRVLLWPLLALCLMYARYKIVSHLRQKRAAHPDANRAALYLYAQLLRLAPWAGRPPQNLTALAEKARFSAHTLTPAELETLKTGLKTAQSAALADKSPLRRLYLRYLRCLC